MILGLEGIEERIPCPHCGSTDCCGIGTDKRGTYLLCVATGKRVTEKQLRSMIVDIEVSEVK